MRHLSYRANDVAEHGGKKRMGNLIRGTNGSADLRL